MTKEDLDKALNEMLQTKIKFSKLSKTEIEELYGALTDRKTLEHIAVYLGKQKLILGIANFDGRAIREAFQNKVQRFRNRHKK